MGAIATAYVQLVPTFDKQLGSSISKQLGGVDTSKAGSRIGRLFTRNVDKGMGGLKSAMTSRFSAATVAIGNVAANVVGRAFSAVGNSMDAAIKRVDTINNFPRIMEGMGIAAEASQASIKRLSAGIDGLPTALDDAVSGVQRFTAKNSDIERSTDMFLAVNNAIASGGASAQIQSSALEQLSQSYSKGKMDMMEWRTLQMAMPAQLNQVAKAMGTTADALGEGLRKGDISMDSFMDTIMQLNKEGVDGLDSFEKQAGKATNGIGTALTNVQNRVNKAVAGVIDAIGQENISKAINDFSSQFGKIGAIIGGTDSEGNVVGFVAGIKRGLETAFDGWTPEFAIDWDSAFKGAQEAAEHVGEWLSKPIASVAKAWDSGLAKVGDAFGKMFEKLDLPEIDWGSLADGVADVAGKLTEFSFDALSNALVTIGDIGAKIGEVVAPALEAAKPGFDSLASAAEKFLTPIADFVSGKGPAFNGMMDRIKGHIDDMGPILQDLAGHFNNICEKLEPLAGPLGEAAAETLGNIFSTIVGLGTIAAGILDTVVTAIDKLLDEFAGLGPAGQMQADALMREFNLVPPTFDRVMGSANGVTDAVNKIPSSKTVTLKADNQAGGVIDGLVGKLANFASTWVATLVTNRQGASASGGISLERIQKVRHADGGMAGIARRATLTNIGWVGEDGAEAIIPLTNKRYVKPFAQAVASEMGGVGRGDQNITVYLQYDAPADAEQITNDIARALGRKLAMEA